jgi:hypothetical protein
MISIASALFGPGKLFLAALHGAANHESRLSFPYRTLHPIMDAFGHAPSGNWQAHASGPAASHRHIVP